MHPSQMLLIRDREKNVPSSSLPTSKIPGIRTYPVPSISHPFGPAPFNPVIHVEYQTHIPGIRTYPVPSISHPFGPAPFNPVIHVEYQTHIPGIPTYPVPSISHPSGPAPLNPGVHGAFQPKKAGKWCAMHARVAWENYHYHQEQQAEAEKREGKHVDPLRPSGHLMTGRHRPPDLTSASLMETDTPQHCDNDDTGAPRKKREENDDESEDEGVDLTDGPIKVKVEPCEQSFYSQNYKKAYPMNQIPRGKAIIINVNKVDGKRPRKGTNIDRDNMKSLLSQFDFQVEVYNDTDRLSASEIILKLEKFSQDEIHESANCTVIVILSHGDVGSIFGTDGIKIPMSRIFGMFDNANSPSLVGKPKLFFIQACRGGGFDKGVSCDETDGGPDMSDATCKLPSQSDMLVCYPTQEGYCAWRNCDRGSWYIEGIVQVFMKYAKKEDICTLLNRVNHFVSKKLSQSSCSEMDQMTQMSEYKSTLRKPHFYFFPGIGSC